MLDPELALETHAREELGIDPRRLGDPLQAAVASFLAFALGAFLPLIPWLVRSRPDGDPVVGRPRGGRRPHRRGRALPLHRAVVAVVGGPTAAHLRGGRRDHLRHRPSGRNRLRPLPRPWDRAACAVPGPAGPAVVDGTSLVGRQLGEIGPVHVVIDEPHAPVQVGGGLVVAVDVEHAHGEALTGQPVQPGLGQGPTPPPAVEVRVDTDHVDLAHRRFGRGMDLGPTRTGQPTTLARSRNPSGSNQGSSRVRAGWPGPSAPARDGEAKARLLVASQASSSSPGRKGRVSSGRPASPGRRRERKRAAHLDQFALDGEPVGLGPARRRRRRPRSPRAGGARPRSAAPGQRRVEQRLGHDGTAEVGRIHHELMAWLIRFRSRATWA